MERLQARREHVLRRWGSAAALDIVNCAASWTERIVAHTAPDTSWQLRLARSRRSCAVPAVVSVHSVAIGLGSVASAQDYSQEALALARELKDKALLARTLNAFGEVYRWAGDLEAAQPLYDESLALGREEGDLAQIAILSLNLARVLIAKGAAAQARDRVREAFRIAEGIGSKWAAQDALDVTAALGAVAGEWMFAALIFGAAESHYKEAGSKRDSVDGAFLAPLTLRTREALGDAAYSAALDAGHALSHEQSVAEALAWLGKSAEA